MEFQEESAISFHPEKPEKLRKLPHKNGRVSIQKADLPTPKYHHKADREERPERMDRK